MARIVLKWVWTLYIFQRIWPKSLPFWDCLLVRTSTRILTSQHAPGWVSLQWRHNGRDSVSITSLTIVYSIVYSVSDQRKHQSSASLAFVRGIHRWPVNSLHKWPVTREMFPFDDVIMYFSIVRKQYFSSLAAPRVVIRTTYGATSDCKDGIMR